MAERQRVRGNILQILSHSDNSKICGNWKNSTVQQRWLGSVATFHPQSDHTNNNSIFTIPLFPLTLDCNTYVPLLFTLLTGTHKQREWGICAALYSPLNSNWLSPLKCFFFFHSTISNRLNTQISSMVKKLKQNKYNNYPYVKRILCEDISSMVYSLLNRDIHYIKQ